MKIMACLKAAAAGAKSSPCGCNASAVAIALALIISSGCDHPSSAPTTVASTPLAATPEGKLEGVMRRLKIALDVAKPAPGSGVRSHRTAMHQLIKPATADGPLKAEVTISTVVGVDQSKGDKGKAASGGNSEIAGEQLEPTAKKEVFVLNYEGESWKLAETPQGEVERLAFDLALKDQ